MRVLIVVAAGSGQRLGADVPKALVELDGRSLVSHGLDRLADGADRVVVVAPPAHVAEVMALAMDTAPDADLTVVAGGDTRTQSVRAGLEAVELADDDLVAVHDAARAGTPLAVLQRGWEAVTGDVVAAGPVLPVSDTVKRVLAGDVVATVPRDDLRVVQTPQVVRADVLRVVLDADEARTDELGLVEDAIADGRIQGRVSWFHGSVLAHKVTRPADLVLLSALLARQDAILMAESITEADHAADGALR